MVQRSAERSKFNQLMVSKAFDEMIEFIIARLVISCEIELAIVLLQAVDIPQIIIDGQQIIHDL